ncbi:MAG TPA: hypothetical protein VFE30_02340 [Anaeromyxobacteraceae bacterium]|nr:hypothetical protein [Anaeromyxobacteraceae bacterium]
MNAPAGGEGKRGAPPTGVVALALSLAALVCCWNALAAPFGLGLGLAGLVVGVMASRRGAPRRRTRAAVILSLLALAGSVVALALSAGTVGVVRGEPVVRAPTPAEADEKLRGLAERTAAARGRAREELSRIEGQDDAGRAREREAGKPGR